MICLGEDPRLRGKGIHATIDTVAQEDGRQVITMESGAVIHYKPKPGGSGLAKLPVAKGDRIGLLFNCIGSIGTLIHVWSGSDEMPSLHVAHQNCLEIDLMQECTL